MFPDLNELIPYYIYGFEVRNRLRIPACSAVSGKRIETNTVIQDLTGFSMGMVTKSAYNFLQISAKLASDNYPETMG
jgi:hypothetical protein